MLRLAFEHLNLRRNPFGVPEAKDWPELAIGELDELAAIVRAGVVVQLIGDAGRGKSTHLRGLFARLPEAAFVYVFEGTRLEPPRAPILLIDEAQRLAPDCLRRLADTPLALGTHEDVSVHLRRREIRTIRLRGMDARRLRGIVERRVEWARRGPGPVPTFSEETLADLLDCHGDDLRSIEARLYDVFQGLERIDTL